MAYESKTIFEIDGTRDMECRVLAQTKTTGSREQLASSTCLQECLPESHAGDENGELLDIRFSQLLGGAFKTQRRQVETEDLVGAVENTPSTLTRFGDIATHADNLGPLPWK